MPKVPLHHGVVVPRHQLPPRRELDGVTDIGDELEQLLRRLQVRHARLLVQHVERHDVGPLPRRGVLLGPVRPPALDARRGVHGVRRDGEHVDGVDVVEQQRHGDVVERERLGAVQVALQLRGGRQQQLVVLVEATALVALVPQRARGWWYDAADRGLVVLVVTVVAHHLRDGCREPAEHRLGRLRHLLLLLLLLLDLRQRGLRHAAPQLGDLAQNVLELREVSQDVTHVCA
mmetsp:Transcript_3494/g.12733  ORF Transcript_3494/g.12733 Transcript_3494/m.12733 type:complete len:232 (+) Transcript_3494:773-1468(+)